MRTKYERAELEIEEISIADVITTSGTDYELPIVPGNGEVK